MSKSGGSSIQMSLLAPDKIQATPDNIIEISVKGKWVKVPALDANVNTIVVGVRWIKVAAIHDEVWLEREIKDPILYVKTLKERRSQALHADIITIAQIL